LARAEMCAPASPSISAIGFNLNYSHFLVPVRFVLASVTPLKGESK
jgi:hypothetical protein